jgi:hypothetical protein
LDKERIIKKIGKLNAKNIGEVKKVLQEMLVESFIRFRQIPTHRKMRAELELGGLVCFRRPLRTGGVSIRQG